ncbi:hypothetical protein C8F01DRAFT_1057557 [Mycena amicta]|nr:hypothetical protein C8F01DRAFT_1057557 [Mycena amicta]
MLSSAFTCRFGTNYGAEDAEVKDIQSILVEPTARLASLDDEIAALQKTMEGLVNERSQLVAFIDNHKALLSPIYKSKIFVACMPVTRNCAMSSREAPLLLGRVCSAWRAICVSTPRLWARLHISQPMGPFANLIEHSKLRIQCERGLATLRDATEMWLARSGQCSLSISVSCSTDGLSNDVFGPDKQSILNILAPFASRWEHVAIFRVLTKDLMRLPKLTAEDFPRLKSITVTEGYPSHDVPQSDVHETKGFWHNLRLFNAESLLRVDLSGSSFYPLWMPLRWASLLEIHIRYTGGRGMPDFALDGAQEVLRRCSALQTFRFSLLYTTTDPTLLAPIEHVALRTLAVEINGDVSAVLRHICHSFILPELRSLSFHGSSSSDPDADDTNIDYPTFLDASPKLEHAQVFLDMFTHGTLPNFLRHLPPSLRRLHILPGSRFWITDPHLVDSELLTLLTPDPDPSIPVVGGGIEELDIDRCKAFNDQQLLSFIKSRIDGGGDSQAHRYRKLKSLAVDFAREMEDDIMPELQQYVEDGLRVNLTYEERGVIGRGTCGERDRIQRPKSILGVKLRTHPPKKKFTDRTGKAKMQFPEIAEQSVHSCTNSLSPGNMIVSRVAPGRREDSAQSCSESGVKRPCVTISCQSLSINDVTCIVMSFSSPFISRFGTNYAAEDVEVAEIQNILLEPTIRLRALDDEIITLQQRIDMLVAERSELAFFVDGHNALLSPIRRMPRDIIEDIFVACLPTTRNSAMSAKEAPLLLGRVCSAWRAISLSTPRLWSRVHIAQPSVFLDALAPDDRVRLWCEQVLVTLREAVLMWLSRSGDCSLSISVHSSLYSVSTDVFGPNRAGILHLLAPFAFRWEHLEIFGASPKDMLSLPVFAPGDLSRLKSIAIEERYYGTPAENEDPPLWDGVSLFGAENLTQISISGSQFDPLLFPFRWDLLSDLTIHKNMAPPTPPFTVATALEILGRCNALRTLRLWINTTSLDLDNRAPLRHDSLRILQLDCVGHVWSIIGELCSHCAFPALRSMIIQGRATVDQTTQGTYVDFRPFLAASPLLEHVEALMDMFTKASLKEFLCELPDSVVRLDLVCGSYMVGGALVDEEILDLLSDSSADNNPSSRIPCVALEELHIDRCAEFSDSQLFHFLSTRMENIHTQRKLKHLVVRFDRLRQFDILPALREYMDDGLKVNLGYYQDQKLSLQPFTGLREDIPEDFT